MFITLLEQIPGVSVVGTGVSFTPTEVLYDGTSGILTATLGDRINNK